MILNEIHAPDGVPPRCEATAPRQVVGIYALEAQGQRRIADLGDEVLPWKEFVGGGEPECETLVDVVTELAVVIHIDRRRVVLIPPNQDGLLPGHETPAVCGLPVQIHEVGGVEHVPLIEDLFVESLADAVINFRGNMAKKMEIKVLPHHLALVLPILSLLMERGPHVHVKPIDTFLGRHESGYPKEQDPSQ